MNNFRDKYLWPDYARREDKDKSLISKYGSVILVYYGTEENRNILKEFFAKNGYVQLWEIYAHYGCPWYYINIMTKVFAHGIACVKVTSTVGEHAVTLDEFFIINDIYSKYRDKKLFEF